VEKIHRYAEQWWKKSTIVGHRGMKNPPLNALKEMVVWGEVVEKIHFLCAGTGKNGFKKHKKLGRK
jgi:hypothetical protein